MSSSPILISSRGSNPARPQADGVWALLSWDVLVSSSFREPRRRRPELLNPSYQRRSGHPLKPVGLRRPVLVRFWMIAAERGSDAAIAGGLLLVRIQGSFGFSAWGVLAPSLWRRVLLLLRAMGVARVMRAAGIEQHHCRPAALLSPSGVGGGGGVRPTNEHGRTV